MVIQRLMAPGAMVEDRLQKTSLHTNLKLLISWRTSAAQIGKLTRWKSRLGKNALKFWEPVNNFM
ncbi:MAG: hypothetical protein DSY70_02520 [Desulfobulbus sp.]|nr:MAG: hypothetical protein DSY70_02520 [Desulfobulbus sp.]